MSFTKIYKKLKQLTKISLDAPELNSNILNNILSKLQKKVEHKCNKIGYVNNVYNIISYSDGLMHPENLNSNVIYEISYNCKICIPEVNTIIVAKISIINQDIIICAVGPLLIFISKNYIESDKLRIVENEIILIESNSKLKINDYVNILLVDVRINTNDTQIKAIGQLLQGSTEEEILNYYDTE